MTVTYCMGIFFRVSGAKAPIIYTRATHQNQEGGPPFLVFYASALLANLLPLGRGGLAAGCAGLVAGCTGPAAGLAARSH